MRRPLERFPYVPSDPTKLAENCYEAYNIQVQGLVKRLQATGTEKVVIGVSGGLDFDPGAARLQPCHGLGRPAARQHPGLHPAGLCHERGHQGQCLGADARVGGERRGDRHPPGGAPDAGRSRPSLRRRPTVYDVTFENVQAGLRTDYLFRLANHNRALVVGTGDLSELGLGWCTYGVGDQMSHYNVNASVSKTLIQHLIRFVAASGDVDQATADILHAILATEISPELVPQETAGAIQSTEAMIGPYPLQDFNLYYLTRYGFRPSKIAYLSWCAWSDAAAGTWPSHIPPMSSGRIVSGRSSIGCGCSCSGSSRTSSNGLQCRTGRRSRQADPFRHGGTGVPRLMQAHQFGLRNSSGTFRIKMTIDDMMVAHQCWICFGLVESGFVAIRPAFRTEPD